MRVVSEKAQFRVTIFCELKKDELDTLVEHFRARTVVGVYSDRQVASGYIVAINQEEPEAS